MDACSLALGGRGRSNFTNLTGFRATLKILSVAMGQHGGPGHCGFPSGLGRHWTPLTFCTMTEDERPLSIRARVKMETITPTRFWAKRCLQGLRGSRFRKIIFEIQGRKNSCEVSGISKSGLQAEKAHLRKELVADVCGSRWPKAGIRNADSKYTGS